MRVRKTGIKPFLFEIHKHLCLCSYCGGLGDSPLHWGLNLPEDKSEYSWRVFKIGKLYIRWTGFWMQSTVK